MLLILFALYSQSISFAEPLSGPGLVWEWRDLSAKYALHSSNSTEHVDTLWRKFGTGKSKDSVELVIPPAYANMHAMVVAAFFAKSKKHRDLAQQWVEKYECENYLACRQFHSFFREAGEKSLSAKQGSWDRLKVEKVRAKAQARIESMKPGSPEDGVCDDEKTRVRWLELEYQLLCPPGPAPQGAHPWKDFGRRLEWDSMQVVMSSSYVSGFAHKGSEDCSEGWMTILHCGGGKPVVYTLTCDRAPGTYPAPVKCKQVKAQNALK